MKLIMIAAASIALASSAHATPNILVQNGTSMRIDYGDLDVRSEAGRAAMADRIHFAAELLCSENNVAPISEKLDRLHCYRTALESGRTEMAKLGR
jgi:UrcA family protein